MRNTSDATQQAALRNSMHGPCAHLCGEAWGQHQEGCVQRAVEVQMLSRVHLGAADDGRDGFVQAPRYVQMLPRGEVCQECGDADHTILYQCLHSRTREGNRGGEKEEDVRV